MLTREFFFVFQPLKLSPTRLGPIITADAQQANRRWAVEYSWIYGVWMNSIWFYGKCGRPNHISMINLHRPRPFGMTCSTHGTFFWGWFFSMSGPWPHLACAPQHHGLGLGWQAPLEWDVVPGPGLFKTLICRVSICPMSEMFWVFSISMYIICSNFLLYPEHRNHMTKFGRSNLAVLLNVGKHLGVAIIHH